MPLFGLIFRHGLLFIGWLRRVRRASEAVEHVLDVVFREQVVVVDPAHLVHIMPYDRPLVLDVCDFIRVVFPLYVLDPSLEMVVYKPLVARREFVFGQFYAFFEIGFQYLLVIY